MKNLFTTILFCFILSLSSYAIGDEDFAGGNGTESNPWQIQTAVQLDNVRNNMSDAQMNYFKLINDIDLHDLALVNNWTHLNTGGNFINLDGNGFVIKNMHIETENDIKPGHYQSFAGVLNGKIKNLGLVDVYINCQGAGAVGAFAGCVGAKNPKEDANTGIIENCFATGYLSGGGGTVGGLAAEIGRPSDGGVTSYIKNSYFSGKVNNTYRGGAATVRTGGIVGVIANATQASDPAQAPVENCYATGHFRALSGRVGGIAGESELTIKNSIAYYVELNDEMIQTANPNSMGLIVGYCNNTNKWGKVENSWALNTSKMNRDGIAVSPNYFITPALGETTPVDGELKDAAFLAVADNYKTNLNFSMDGAGAVWSNQLRTNRYPQLLWVSQRADSESIDGLSHATLASDFSGGDGTEASPWEIRTAAEFNAIRMNNGTEHSVNYFKLMADVDLNDLPVTEYGNWIPIHLYHAYIDLDGNGYVARNLTITRDDKGQGYQSLAGVLQGSIRNLGLVDVNIDVPNRSTSSSFAGYLGSATPGDNAFATGIIENCYATGYVSATPVVGGIAATIGRHANDGTPSYIKNSYFSGELYNTYSGTGLGAFTGGIAGGVLVNPTESVQRTPAIQNCFATGSFVAEKQKVGGIVGYTESTIKDCVSYANIEVKDATGFIGLITGYSINGPKGVGSGTTATTYGIIDNCYAYDAAIITKGASTVTPSNFTTPASGEEGPVDGSLKDRAYTMISANYSTDINFQISGEGAAWSNILRGNTPQLLWVSQRADRKDIDGLSDWAVSVNDKSMGNEPTVFSTGNLLIFKGMTEACQVSVYNVSGVLLERFLQNEDGAAIVITQSPVVIVKLVGKSGSVVTTKVLRE